MGACFRIPVVWQRDVPYVPLPVALTPQYGHSARLTLFLIIFCTIRRCEKMQKPPRLKGLEESQRKQIRAILLWQQELHEPESFDEILWSTKTMRH